jgi:hypothetical protein
LLASVSHICKNRDKNTQCFNVLKKVIENRLTSFSILF